MQALGRTKPKYRFFRIQQRSDRYEMAFQIPYLNINLNENLLFKIIEEQINKTVVQSKRTLEIF